MPSNPFDRITIFQGDITTLEMDAIVNAAIAFPAISCGVYGYPIEKAATIAMDTTTRYIKKTSQLKMITFVLFSRHDFDIYTKKMAKTRLKFVFTVDKAGCRE